MSNTKADERQWVNDWCEQRRIDDIDRKRAEGIMKIHETCTPPCLRVLAARRYLESYGYI
ncbi:hypothetical protein ACWDNI_35980 [Nocardia niigatensis]